MRRSKLLSALVITAMIAGCATPYSEAPLATNFPSSKQPKLRAAAHWNAIAGDVAKQLADHLKDRQPLYVNRAQEKTEFDRAFSNQLISALVAQGFMVQKNATGALTVDIDTQTVRFATNRPQYNYSGAATALTAGVWALHNASPAGIATAGIVGADAYFWFRSEFAIGETPQSEIIVTASVSNRDQYLSRNTSVYYVADADQSLYQAPMPPMPVKAINLVGGK